jgi:hypothetical protein
MVALDAAGARVYLFLRPYCPVYFCGLGIMCLTIAPVGLNLYANYGGSRWIVGVWFAYVLAGWVAGVLLIVSVVRYLD